MLSNAYYKKIKKMKEDKLSCSSYWVVREGHRIRLALYNYYQFDKNILQKSHLFQVYIFKCQERFYVSIKSRY